MSPLLVETYPWHCHALQFSIRHSIIVPVSHDKPMSFLLLKSSRLWTFAGSHEDYLKDSVDDVGGGAGDCRHCLVGQGFSAKAGVDVDDMQPWMPILAGV